MLKNNRASLETKEIIGLILGAGVVVLLFILMWGLISPGFNKDKETAKSYIASFENAIEEADAGKIGEVFILQKSGISLNYYGKIQYQSNSNINIPKQKIVCACKLFGTSNEKTFDCFWDYYVELKYPLKIYSNHDLDFHWIKQTFYIRKVENEETYYEFTYDLEDFENEE